MPDERLLDTRTWRSGVAVRAAPEDVLNTLTDIDACETWSPVGFRVEGLTSRRLRAGTTTAVSGRLAGCRVRFRVDVFQADANRLALRAVGPVEVLASYDVRQSRCGAHVDAAISVRRGRGPCAAMAVGATSGLLAAGALDHALARIARHAEHHNSLADREQRLVHDMGVLTNPTDGEAA
jgi:hypothetical protein